MWTHTECLVSPSQAYCDGLRFDAGEFLVRDKPLLCCDLASSGVGHNCYMNIVGVTLSRCFNFQALHFRRWTRSKDRGDKGYREQIVKSLFAFPKVIWKEYLFQIDPEFLILLLKRLKHQKYLRVNIILALTRAQKSDERRFEKRNEIASAQIWSIWTHNIHINWPSSDIWSLRD